MKIHENNEKFVVASETRQRGKNLDEHEAAAVESFQEELAKLVSKLASETTLDVEIDIYITKNRPTTPEVIN